jgi:hypothetical protein
MKEVKFLGKLFLFCVPLLLVLGFPIWILYRSGELTSYATMAALQASSKPVLVGIKYTDSTPYLKLQETILKKPNVLVLSDSRAEEYSADFFKPGAKVFNAWAVISKISHYRHFIDKLPSEDSPKVILMVLDPKFFNLNYDSLAPDDIDTQLTQPATLTDALAQWAIVYKDYFAKKFTLGEIVRADGSAIGVTALGGHGGFRNDGSYDPGVATYSTNDPRSADYHFGTTLANINNGINGMERSQQVSTPALNELDAFLAECAARHIAVIGVLPPFAPAIYNKLLSMSDQYGYFTKLAPALKPIFVKNGFIFYNFIDPSSLGWTDANMTDGVHPTERGALMEFAAIAKNDKTLQQYVDLARLKQGLASGKEFSIYAVQ